MASNQKVEEKRPTLKLNFTYWGVFSGQVGAQKSEYEHALYKLLRNYNCCYLDWFSMRLVYMMYTGVYTGCIHL